MAGHARYVPVTVNNGTIEIRSLEIERGRVGHIAKDDLWVPAMKIGQPRYQPLRREGWKDGDVQRAPFRLTRDQFERRRLEVGQHGLHSLVVALARRRERKTLMTSLEQTDADPALQFLQLFANGALRQIEALRGAGYAAKSDDFGKCTKQR